jgi:adenylate kinase
VDGVVDVALNLVLMGPPGAGKGTQAERFARDHRIPTISTGDILREAVADRTPLGLQAKAVMDGGELVGDDLIIPIVRDRLARADAMRGFVLDGFPRNVAQASALDQMLTERGPVIVVEIQVPDDELVRRVASRRICSRCGRTASAFGDGAAATGTCSHCGGPLIARSDDTERVVRDRLKVYWRETKPMIAYYHARPTYRVVNGAQAPERVYDALVAAVASAPGQPSAHPEGAGRRPESDA